MRYKNVNSHEDQVVLSIVIVNSDDTVHTLGCLDSIFLHQPDVNYEVILVDNHSDESCLSIIEEVYPEVRVLLTPERQGLARNYNLGMRQARGEYIMILNNFTIIHPGTFATLMEGLQMNDDYGMVGPLLRTPDWYIQTDCARRLPSPMSYTAQQLFLDPVLPIGRLLEWIGRQRLARRPSGPVPCISGVCMLASRETLELVGLLDEGFDFYYENFDWCHRIKQHGLKVAYIAEAVVTHYKEQSVSKIREIAKQSEYQSALRYFSQYYRFNYLQRWLLWMVTVLGYSMRAGTYRVVELFTEKATSYSSTCWRSAGWILMQAPFRTERPVVDMTGPLRLKVEEGE